MRIVVSSTSFLLLVVIASACYAQEIVDQWRYTLRRPDTSWRQPDFDDADWTNGYGGFGTRGTPGARVGTTWSTNSIWLRKSFERNAIPAKPALLIHHDEDAEVYVNGKQVAKVPQTDSLETYVDAKSVLAGTQGVEDICLVVRGSGEDLIHLDHFQFVK